MKALKIAICQLLSAGFGTIILYMSIDVSCKMSVSDFILPSFLSVFIYNSLLSVIGETAYQKISNVLNINNYGKIKMSNEETNIDAKNSQVFNKSSHNNATQQSEPQNNKPQFNIGWAIFIIIFLMIVSITVLQYQGKLGNRTFERILSTIIPLTDTLKSN